MSVLLTVTCECGAVLGMWHDSIDEKYPFWCETCDEYKHGGKYPWTLKAEVVNDGPA